MYLLYKYLIEVRLISSLEKSSHILMTWTGWWGQILISQRTTRERNHFYVSWMIGMSANSSISRVSHLHKETWSLLLAVPPNHILTCRLMKHFKLFVRRCYISFNNRRNLFMPWDCCNSRFRLPNFVYSPHLGRGSGWLFLALPC